jgi:hypothetical protein
MNTRKANFEVVPLSRIAHLLAAEQKLVVMPERRHCRMLSVTSRPTLVRTRKLLFTATGARVSSAESLSLPCIAREKPCAAQIIPSIPRKGRRCCRRQFRT